MRHGRVRVKKRPRFRRKKLIVAWRDEREKAVESRSKGRQGITVVPNELQKYKAMNTRVENKSGEELVNIISENVGRMLRRKMDAVTCIRMAAEEHAENWENDEEEGNFTYVSGKYSPVNAELPKLPSNMEKNIDAYRFIGNCFYTI